MWVPIWAKGSISDGGRCVYGGLGVGRLDAVFRPDYGGSTYNDTSWAGYARLGYARASTRQFRGRPVSGVYGLELRYTFGSSLNFDGQDMDADGLQVMVVVYAKPGLSALAF